MKGRQQQCTIGLERIALRSALCALRFKQGRHRRAFIHEQAAQCGYCLNGMIITTKALLLRSPHPSEDEVLEALRHHLCRCGAHVEIMRAAMRAAGYVVEAQA